MMRGTVAAEWIGENRCPLAFFPGVTSRWMADDGGRRKPVFKEDGV